MSGRFTYPDDWTWKEKCSDNWGYTVAIPKWKNVDINELSTDITFNNLK